MTDLESRMLRALERYGNHEVIDGVGCCASYDGKPCNCGFEALIQDARSREQEPQKSAFIQPAQWWLVELDRYDNCVRMVDGAHSEAEGANKAAYLIKSLGALIGSEKRKFAVAKIELGII
jgi:hypothetical protein